MIVTLGKNNNFSISSASTGGVIVNSSVSGGIVQSTVNNLKGENMLLAIADEQIVLYDGKVLKRIKENFIIE